MNAYWWGMLVGWLIGTVGVVIVLAVLSAATKFDDVATWYCNDCGLWFESIPPDHKINPECGHLMCHWMPT